MRSAIWSLFVLLPGQRHDITAFEALLAGLYCLALIGDKAFDAHWLREQLQRRNIEAVIPLRAGTTGYPEHDRDKYKWRQAFRRIATLYEKIVKRYAAMIYLVAVILRTR